MAGLLQIGWRSPGSEIGRSGAKSPIVSGGYLKYSRFRETAAGDRVRSGLRGGVGIVSRWLETASISTASGHRVVVFLGQSLAENQRQLQRWLV
jgi:hypothetical protein